MSGENRPRLVLRHINTQSLDPPDEDPVNDAETEPQDIQESSGTTYSDFSDWSLVFKDIYITKRDTDLQFIVGKEKQVFQAHRYTLERRSPKLCELFKEKKTCLELPSTTPIAFDYFLRVRKSCIYKAVKNI
jgi:hypothetical protein